MRMISAVFSLYVLMFYFRFYEPKLIISNGLFFGEKIRGVYHGPFRPRAEVDQPTLIYGVRCSVSLEVVGLLLDASS